MIVDGEYEFTGPRQAVWDLLQDPDVMVKAMPGAKQLTRTGEGVYEGVIRIGVGPVTAAEWRLTVTLSNLVPPESYDMAVDSKGPVGFTRGSARVELLEDAPSTTRMRYHADLQIGGKVAGVGQRLLDQVAKLLTKQGLQALSRELAARLAEDQGASAAADSNASANSRASTSAGGSGDSVTSADSGTSAGSTAGPEATPDPLASGSASDPRFGQPGAPPA